MSFKIEYHFTDYENELPESKNFDPTVLADWLDGSYILRDISNTYTLLELQSLAKRFLKTEQYQALGVVADILDDWEHEWCVVRCTKHC